MKKEVSDLESQESSPSHPNSLVVLGEPNCGVKSESLLPAPLPESDLPSAAERCGGIGWVVKMKKWPQLLSFGPSRHSLMMFSLSQLSACQDCDE